MGSTVRPSCNEAADGRPRIGQVARKRSSPTGLQQIAGRFADIQQMALVTIRFIAAKQSELRRVARWLGQTEVAEGVRRQ